MVGQQLAERYRIVDVLAKGEFGTVCLADDPTLGRQVEIKLFRLRQGRLVGREQISEVPDEEAFLRRARCIAQLEHSSIVPIFDFGRYNLGRQEDALFLVMPVLGAATLATELRAGRIPVEEVFEIAAQVAEALDYCNSRGVSHGDIQPENILLRRDDGILRVWLKDFAAIAGDPAEEVGRDLQDLSGLLRETVHLVAQQEGEASRTDRHLRYAANISFTTGREFAEALRKRRRSLGRQCDPSATRKKSQDFPLVGRGPEMGSLLQHLQAALRGECQLAFVGGEPGSGKSRLLRELACHGRERQLRVLTGSFGVGGGRAPYQGFGELVLDAFLQVGRGEWEGGPPQWADPGAELLTFFPELDEIIELDGEAPAAASSGGGELQFFELLARTLVRIADQRPTLFLLENLHQSEQASMALDYLVRRLGSIPTMLVATYRPQKLSRNHRLTHVLREARNDPRCCTLELGPLSEAAHTELLASFLGSAVPCGQARKLYEISGGVPFFLREMVRSLDEARRRKVLDPSESGDLLAFFAPWPMAVEEMVDRCLAPLPKVCRQVLEAASTLGMHFGQRDLEALVMDLETAEDSISSLCRAGLLQAVERDLLAFSSGLIRQVIAGGLSTEERRRLRHRHREVLDARVAGRRQRAVRLRANLSGGASSVHEA